MADRASNTPPQELLQGLLNDVLRADLTILHRQAEAWSALGVVGSSSLPMAALAIETVRITCAYRPVPWWVRIWRATWRRSLGSARGFELCGRDARGGIAIEVVVRRGSGGALEVESSP